MLSFKPDVRVVHFTARLGDVLEAATLWSLKARVDVEVNSMNDGPGVHMPTSLHYVDCAIDLDTAGDKPADTAALADFLRRWLPAAYDVLFEQDHVHVEWDMHRPPVTRQT